MIDKKTEEFIELYQASLKDGTVEPISVLGQHFYLGLLTDEDYGNIAKVFGNCPTFTQVKNYTAYKYAKEKIAIPLHNPILPRAPKYVIDKMIEDSETIRICRGMT